MKRLSVICGVLALIFGTACTKDWAPKKEVRVHIFEGGATVKLVGQNGQGTYQFTEDIDSLELPDYGKYQICATFGGGCGGLRVTKEVSNGEENVLLVGPEGGVGCVGGQQLASHYYASVNCE